MIELFREKTTHGMLKAIRGAFAPNTRKIRTASTQGAEVKFGSNPLYEGRNKGGENPLFEAAPIQTRSASQPQITKRSVTTARSPFNAPAQRSQTVPRQAKSVADEFEVRKSNLKRSDENQEVSWPFNVQSSVKLREVD